MVNFFSKFRHNQKKEEKIQEKENQKIDKEFIDEYETLCFKYNRMIVPKMEYAPDAIIPRLEVVMKRKGLPEAPKEEKVEEKKEEVKEEETEVIQGTTSTEKKEETK